VNARRNGGRTPLHEAAQSNSNPAVLATLLDAGADVNAWGVDWSTIGGMSMEWERRSILHAAAQWNGSSEIVSLLVEAGADVNARMKSGSTPLHLAARHNMNPAAIEALVSGGADLGARDGDGRTPLHLAALDNPAFFPMLLRLGADPGVPDDEGETPLDLARENEALEGLEIVRRSRQSRPDGLTRGTWSASSARGVSLPAARESSASMTWQLRLSFGQLRFTYWCDSGSPRTRLLLTGLCPRTPGPPGVS